MLRIVGFQAIGSHTNITVYILALAVGRYAFPKNVTWLPSCLRPPFFFFFPFFFFSFSISISFTFFSFYYFETM